MSLAMSQQSAMDQAVRHLVTNYNPKGNRVGWLMMSSILVEAWDLYSIAFVLVFIREQYNPTRCCSAWPPPGRRAVRWSARCWAAGCRTRSGAGSCSWPPWSCSSSSPWCRPSSPASAGWSWSASLLGIPLGSDISNGYTYIMESMPKGEREVMGNRWQFMFAVGEVLTLAVIAVFIVANLAHELVWRVTLGLGALPALVILLMRHDLPETAVWLIRHGRFREAKQVSMSMYSDDLAMLPTRTSSSPKPRPTRLPGRHPPGPDPLARDAVWLDRLLLPGQRVLHLRLLPAGAVRHGRRVVDPRHRPRDHGAVLRRRRRPAGSGRC